MEGDQHDVGAQAIRVLLEWEGWKVYYLGANVPLEEFATIQVGQAASLVAVSLSPKNALPDLQRVIRTLGEFYRPHNPYALALGGTLPEVSRDQLPDGPFRSFSLSHSAQEFASWLEGLSEVDRVVAPQRDS
jgi:methylmalonyl-CoA mutase cobalamin-binding subunit